MIKKALLVFLALLCLAACKKKSTNDPSTEINNEFDFDSLYQVGSSYDISTHILTINVKLAPNLHAYAKGESVGKPVRLEIKPTNGWGAKGEPNMPAGTAKNNKKIISGSFSISQELIPGRGKGLGILHMQVCTDDFCDRPKAHPFSW